MADRPDVPDRKSERADFAPLGDAEFPGPPELFQWCEEARTVTSNAGLIIMQAAWDIGYALSSIPVMEGPSANVRARRVARHAKRAGDHFHAAQVCFARLPREFLRQYQDVIAQERRGRRKPFNVNGT